MIIEKVQTDGKDKESKSTGSVGGSGTGLERKGEVSENIDCPGKEACNNMNQAAGATVVKRPLDWQKLDQERGRPVKISES